MVRPCTICIHDQRAEIDQALASGKPFRYVSERFGTSRSAAFRHKRDHLAPHLARALEEANGARAADLVRVQEADKAREIGQALDVVRQLKAINGACLEILQKSRASGKDTVSLGAVDRIHKQIELQARLLGELHEGQTVNVLVAPEWHQIRLVVVQALHPYPEARAAVAQALAALPAAAGGDRAR
jgi:hypothetical protein